MNRPARPATERAAATRTAAPPRGHARAPAAARPSLSLSIQLGEGVRELPVSRARIRRWVAASIEADATLTIRFVGEREGRMLNRQYRHRDYATNVLTFPYHAAGERVSADIVICLPVVRREAREQRKTAAAHLAHLVVHGVLHACGHDHEHREQAELMERTEVGILARFGIGDPWRG